MSFQLCVLLAFFATGTCTTGKEYFPQNTFGKGVGEAFVHLFEWSWDDVAKECEDWLGPKGYTAVQISPPSEHIEGAGWFTRYQPVSFKLVSRSGNESQLRSMVNRCAQAGVDIYADIVVNQFAGPWGGKGIAGTEFGYRAFGDLFGPEDFHHLPGNPATNCGIDNYHDKHVIQYCDLLGMPDVCTGCPKTQDKIAKYINNLADIGVKGIRMDAAKHQNAEELGQLLAKVNPSLYRFLEVILNGDEAVTAPPYYPVGQITEFHVAFNLAPKFTAVNLTDNLTSFGEQWGFMDSSQAVIFMDNHDTQRDNAPLTFQRDSILYVLANVYMLAMPYGYPKVMSSYYFTNSDEGRPDVPVHGLDGQINCGDGINWVCEHRSTAIANMINWRKSAGNAPLTNFVGYGDGLFFCRKNKACVAINMKPEPLTVTLQTDMAEGYYCDVSQSDEHNCPFVKVKADGKVDLSVPRMSTLAFHVGKRPGQVSAMTLSEASETRSMIYM